MPLYEQREDGLRAFTQVKPGPDLFESEIPALLGNQDARLIEEQ